jgi:uncharacterized protein YodC (DUF2158 family)
MDDLAPGDVVQLKSGGPVMTIASIGDYYGERKALCEWFDNKKSMSGTFHLHSLLKQQ